MAGLLEAESVLDLTWPRGKAREARWTAGAAVGAVRCGARRRVWGARVEWSGVEWRGTVELCTRTAKRVPPANGTRETLMGLRDCGSAGIRWDCGCGIGRGLQTLCGAADRVSQFTPLRLARVRCDASLSPLLAAGPRGRCWPLVYYDDGAWLCSARCRAPPGMEDRTGQEGRAGDRGHAKADAYLRPDSRVSKGKGPKRTLPGRGPFGGRQMAYAWRPLPQPRSCCSMWRARTLPQPGTGNRTAGARRIAQIVRLRHCARLGVELATTTAPSGARARASSGRERPRAGLVA